MSRLLTILFLCLIAGRALAQAPPAVPALPDTERRTSYSITGTTCNCAVNFALYGDGTDYQSWVEVWINGIRANYNDPAYGWTITSPTGPLANIPRPVTDAVLTFSQPQSGTIQIVGARRPRRVSQFTEGRGVAARDLNQALTDIIAQNREAWDHINDLTGRVIQTQPGNIMGLLPLPAACRATFLGFDATGLNPVCLPESISVGGFTSLVVPSRIALQLVATTAAQVVFRLGYYGPGDGGYGVYYPSNSPCSLNGGDGDGGSQVYSADAKCWLLQPQSTYDFRIWGAVADLKIINSAITTVNGSPNVTVAGGAFTAADVGKYVVLTGSQQGTKVNGAPVVTSTNFATFNSSIRSVTDATHIVLAGNVPWTLTGIGNYVYYGTIDNAPEINECIAFVGTLATAPGNPFPTCDGGGGQYGVASPVKINANDIKVQRALFAALTPSGFPFGTDGVLEFTGNAFIFDAENLTADAAYLPISACFANVNGTSRARFLTCKNTLGSTATTTTLTGVSTVQEASGTASIGSCSGSAPYTCTMTVSALSSGRYQPGQALDDGGVHIPAGTYLQGYGDKNTTGSVGTYIVRNETVSPAVGSQTVNSIGVGLTVTGGSTADIGLFSHGNTNILDRTMVVGYSGGAIFLNKAPTKAFSGATIILTQDADAFYMPTGGMHVDSLVVNQDDFWTWPGNRYGCGFYGNGGGGTNVSDNSNISYYAVSICLGPTSGGFIFSDGWTFNGENTAAPRELNLPASTQMDGASGNYFRNWQTVGQSQYFDISDTHPKTAFLLPQTIADGGSAYYAPQNEFWIYTNQANAVAGQIEISLGSAQQDGIQSNNLNEIAFTSGPGGSWGNEFPDAFTTWSSVSVLPYGGVVTNFPKGIQTGGAPIQNYSIGSREITASDQTQQSDCGSAIQYNAAGGDTLTLSSTIEASLVTDVCRILIISRASGSLTIAAGAGVTIYSGGSSVSSVTLAAHGTPLMAEYAANNVVYVH